MMQRSAATGPSDSPPYICSIPSRVYSAVIRSNWASTRLAVWRPRWRARNTWRLAKSAESTGLKNAITPSTRPVSRTTGTDRILQRDFVAVAPGAIEHQRTILALRPGHQVLLGLLPRCAQRSRVEHVSLMFDA